MMTVKEIRQKFLDFFESKDHKIVPSAPIVNQNDPTLMFMNSGMAQFKDAFLGNETPVAPRVADTQKCLRVSGKHNDLEDVGRDSYHQTMFEMLGNWSFGDYFKKEAIAWAWELLTEVYQMPKDRLYVTIFEGDEEDKTAPDEEAYELWQEWIAKDRILRAGKKDNFWEMGAQGPCGPCSEIHIDIRPQAERDLVDGKTLVNQDHPLVIEIWNLVFMQFNRLADGSLVPLASKCIDTGMGLERVAMALQGKTSNYDTDLFQPLIQLIEKKSGIAYTNSYAPEAKTDIAMRVMADHIRAVALVIADGQRPDSTGAGYVVRSILRRAVRYGYSFLNIQEPFIYTLIPTLADSFDTIFPEVKAQQKMLMDTIKGEEEAFLKTLERGLKLFDSLLEKDVATEIEAFLKKEKIGYKREQRLTPKGSSAKTALSGFKFDFVIPSRKLGLLINRPKNPRDETIIELAKKRLGIKSVEYLYKNKIDDVKKIFPDLNYNKTISGYDAFKLLDTYGFPIDLTKLLAKEKGYEVDEKGFEKALEEQKKRSKADAKKEVDDWVVLSDEKDVTFVGYNQHQTQSRVLKYRKVRAKGKDQYQIVLNETPFYAESGGQVGDTGVLWFGEEKIPVLDTKKENNLIVHWVKALPSQMEEQVTAEINSQKRHLTEKNHSVAHLAHAALRQVLGTHVQQKGSYVAPEKMRFDFSHNGRMTEEELREVETLVNAKIRANIPLKEENNVPLEEARQSGAMMLFGEKYGESVRIITFDDAFSKELCGGCHVKATGEIGLFKIVSEGSVASGIRRIEALTGQAALEYVQKEAQQLSELRQALKNPKNLNKAVLDLLQNNKQMQKDLEKMALLEAKLAKGDLEAQVEGMGLLNFLGATTTIVSKDGLKQLSNSLHQSIPNLVLVLGGENKGKALLTVSVDPEVVKKYQLHAGNIVKAVASHVNGGGGGKPFYATAGGKNPAGISNALQAARELVDVTVKKVDLP